MDANIGNHAWLFLHGNFKHPENPNEFDKKHYKDFLVKSCYTMWSMQNHLKEYKNTLLN